MTIAALRNNNPFNISLPRSGYFGGSVVGIINQPGYASFPNMATGYAAGAQRISDYISGNTSYGNLNTISKLGNIYAEGPQGGQVWANGVSQISGIPLNQTLDPSNAAQMQALQTGILGQEGTPTSLASQYGPAGGGTAIADGPADTTSGFNAGSTEAAPQGGAADPNADPQAGGEAAPMGGADPNNPNAGNGTTTTDGTGTGTPTSTGTGTGTNGGGSGSGAGGGQAIPINLQVLGPGTTQPITGWVDKIMKGFGTEAQNITDASIKTVDTYFSNLLGGVSNWFVRAFLIFLGIIIIAIGLVVLMWDHGGEQVAAKAGKVVRI